MIVMTCLRCGQSWTTTADPVNDLSHQDVCPSTLAELARSKDEGARLREEVIRVKGEYARLRGEVVGMIREWGRGLVSLDEVLPDATDEEKEAASLLSSAAAPMTLGGAR